MSVRRAFVRVGSLHGAVRLCWSDDELMTGRGDGGCVRGSNTCGDCCTQREELTCVQCRNASHNVVAVTVRADVAEGCKSERRSNQSSVSVRLVPPATALIGKQGAKSILHAGNQGCRE
eukprot:9483307-Pyramimonas_sp.AAC.1